MTIISITSLCLACSSSFPPQSESRVVFTTQCCARPICDSCISKNRRLAQYNPCLACLGGVQAVGLRNSGGNPLIPLDKVNIDGAVRDEDTFVLGSDEDEEEDLGSKSAPPPPYLQQTASLPAPPVDQEGNGKQNLLKENNPVTPHKYYIQRGDTCLGIAFRFGVDGRELCRLNKLPPSTLTTTPHLLHTRTFLDLPFSARVTDKDGNSLLESSENIQEKLRAVRRTRERAEKRLQTMTKEVDWRVAKAYVALAEDADSQEFELKRKETGSVPGMKLSPSSDLEMLALDKYLDDDEWEASQNRVGQSSSHPNYGKEQTFKRFWR
ncbi:hypothetical protein BDP27DRAFT_1429015 [Rhodocollybia butyracea]|uniref:LysM domain-containing protein n=1 Tax=Rhodocollybia butyracea TaxID=206335 RepID=A0A9P5PG19_9AGAR|nr:hypothetical protein BDP27DRAFT_1429015 [Rhodocollybia butyracea]